MRIAMSAPLATAGAAALFTLAGLPASAVAPPPVPAPGTESFVMAFLTVQGVDRPTTVAATGPISAVGTETQTDRDTAGGEIVVFTWHLARGTVTAHAVEQYHFVPNYRTCTAKATGTGTWTIVDGTGAYANAAGSGTFTAQGSFVGARDSQGRCDPNAEPVLSAFVLRGTGTASLGAGA